MILMGGVKAEKEGVLIVDRLTAIRSRGQPWTTSLWLTFLCVCGCFNA